MSSLFSSPAAEAIAAATLARGESRAQAIERATVRRVSRRLIPLLFLLYVVCFIDRTSVSFAALQMNRDLGFSAAVYGLGAGIFFIGYALFEVPSNVMLARVGARRWIGRIAITWGVIASAMMFVHDRESFFVLRFLLGVAEAGYFPGVVYYLGQWFPERYRGRALARFAIGIPISAMVGAPLGTALLALDGRMGLAGWQWLFLVEGIPAVILGLVALRFLTDRPVDAQWLTQEQREWLSQQLRSEPRRNSTGSLRAALLTGTVWRLAAPYVLLGTASYALVFWIPKLLQELGGVGIEHIGLVVSAIGVVSAIAMLATGASSDHRRERVMHAAVPLAAGGIGFFAAAAAPWPAAAIAGLAFAFVALHCFFPAFWCLPAMLLRGPGTAAGIALVNSLGNVGGFFGPNLIGVLKGTTGTFTSALAVLGGVAVAGALLIVLLLRRHSAAIAGESS